MNCANNHILSKLFSSKKTVQLYRKSPTYLDVFGYKFSTNVEQRSIRRKNKNHLKYPGYEGTESIRK